MRSRVVEVLASDSCRWNDAPLASTAARPPANARPRPDEPPGLALCSRSRRSCVCSCVHESPPRIAPPARHESPPRIAPPDRHEALRVREGARERAGTTPETRRMGSRQSEASGPAPSDADPPPLALEARRPSEASPTPRSNEQPADSSLGDGADACESAGAGPDANGPASDAVKGVAGRADGEQRAACAACRAQDAATPQLDGAARGDATPHPACSRPRLCLARREAGAPGGGAPPWSRHRTAAAQRREGAECERDMEREDRDEADAEERRTVRTPGDCCEADRGAAEAHDPGRGAGATGPAPAIDPARRSDRGDPGDAGAASDEDENCRPPSDAAATGVDGRDPAAAARAEAEAEAGTPPARPPRGEGQPGGGVAHRRADDTASAAPDEARCRAATRAADAPPTDAPEKEAERPPPRTPRGEAARRAAKTSSPESAAEPRSSPEAHASASSEPPRCADSARRAAAAASSSSAAAGTASAGQPARRGHRMPAASVSGASAGEPAAPTRRREQSGSPASAASSSPAQCRGEKGIHDPCARPSTSEVVRGGAERAAGGHGARRPVRSTV